MAEKPREAAQLLARYFADTKREIAALKEAIGRLDKAGQAPEASVDAANQAFYLSAGASTGCVRLPIFIPLDQWAYESGQYVHRIEDAAIACGMTAGLTLTDETRENQAEMISCATNDGTLELTTIALPTGPLKGYVDLWESAVRG